VASLRAAYRQGIFPWPVEGLPLLWFCQRNAVCSSSARSTCRGAWCELDGGGRCSSPSMGAFAEVIRACAATPRPGQPGTWITPAVLSAYTQLHRVGFAHSVEAWDGQQLVGGVYGVDVDGAFAAESMFYWQPNASKLALLHLISHLESRGLDWMDIQVLTPQPGALGRESHPARGVSGQATGDPGTPPAAVRFTLKGR